MNGANMLKHLNEKNDVEIFGVKDQCFASYGRVVEGIDCTELLSFMQMHTSIPEDGNVYVASVPEMEAIQAAKIFEGRVYGGMPIQVGYCNGRNTTYNGFEYHKGSEINIAVTDFMLVLGHTWEIRDNCYRVEDAKVFFVEKGTAIEMYQTSLHLSPCRTSDEGFKDIVILPRGTNTPLEEKEKYGSETGEGRLLLQKNKWVISHPDREPLMRQGAYPGLLGENKELYY